MFLKEKFTVSMEFGVMTWLSSRPSPIVISVPHDGLPQSEFYGLLSPRIIGHKIKDLYTWSMTRDILTSMNNPGANAVRGLMPRAYVDYNRSWPDGVNYYPKTQIEVHTAIDDPSLEHVYKKYHAIIDRIIDGSIKKFGKKKVLLIDFHGFTNQPPYAPEGGFDIIMGTGNRASINHGDIDVEFYDYMTRLGYKVFLPKDLSHGPVEDWYSADFTTRHHSCKHKINAIQLEIACRFRKKSPESLGLGKKLSGDIASFLDKHIGL